MLASPINPKQELGGDKNCHQRRKRYLNKKYYSSHDSCQKMYTQENIVRRAPGREYKPVGAPTLEFIPRRQVL